MMSRRFLLCSVLLNFVRFIRASDDTDAFDLSFYKKGAAIGDSYTAGIGAGNRINWGCSRYDGSFANLVQLNLETEAGQLDFTYTACSGAVVEEILDQAKSLSTGQEFVLMSAGGNDANLVGILNSCVFSFYYFLYHPNCDKVLDASREIIRSDEFASDLDELIETVKGKLTDDGRIYYTGYAKFFEVLDTQCDKVSWHIWWEIGTREYLTLNRRRKMNDLVEAMNEALSAATKRAGPKVHFIDYDQDAGNSRGRYCQPGQDESGGKGADLEDLFFYQMKSADGRNYHDELKRREDPIESLDASNTTLGAVYGAMIEEAIEFSRKTGTLGYAAINDDNMHADTIEMINDTLTGDHAIGAAEVTRQPIIEPLHVMARSDPWNMSLIDTHASTLTPGDQEHPIGLKLLPNARLRTATMSSFNGTWQFANDTTLVNETSTGTVIANQTHLQLNGRITTQSFSISGLFINDMLGRVFHPTRGGHALIANMILWYMARDNAERLGMDLDSFPPLRADTTGEGWPEISGPSCARDSSNTWADADAIRNASEKFCAEPRNVRGSTGDLTSATYGEDFDYMNISISWDSDQAVIGQHACTTWFNSLAKGYRPPNNANLRHGGVVDYHRSDDVNATLRIQPLVMRRIWDGGKAGGQRCNSVNSNHYLTQATLQSNIGDYCTESAETDIAESGQKFERTYNEGTSEEVKLTTAWPTGPRNYQTFRAECAYYMSVLNNGCSLPGENNRMNWKHGGTMTDNNDVRYTIEPQRTRPSPPSEPHGTCKSPWELGEASYRLRVTGAGFAHADSGRELRKQLSGCSPMKRWNFKYFDEPKDDGTEWEARVNIGAMKSHCIRRAIRSAGGYFNENQC